ncbi:MAG: hypothetical protein A2297_05765 [Elusimicrobia bacterium RIFOXYB2_FULL_48_7]|nr:MAG: hypothetical protein A2297_05765 [Elusimicrobia bacterium RIFOXYB2_FULL_48_7]
MKNSRQSLRAVFIPVMVILLILISRDMLHSEIFQSPGTSGLTFLKIGFAARPQAMGGNFSSLSNDLSAFEYNIAGLGFVMNSQYAFTHVSLFNNDISADNFMFGFGFGEHALGFSVKMLKTSDNTRSTADVGGVQTVVQGDEITLSDSKFSVGYANCYPLNFKEDKTVNFGLALNVISEKLGDSQVSAFTGDIGLLYNFRGTGERFGATLQNVGSTSGTDNLPTTLRLSPGYATKDISLSMDLITSVDPKIRIGIGVEIPVQKLFALRFGCGYQQTVEFSAGFGIKLGHTKLDYAYTPHVDLGTSSRITLIVDFSTEP